MGPYFLNTITLSIVIYLVPLCSQAADLRTFHNKKYGFTVRYPSSWNLQSLSEHFYIENFPGSKFVKGVRLPPGGAGISVSVPSEFVHQPNQSMPLTMEEWVSLGTARRKVNQKRDFSVSNGKRTLPVIEVVTQCCAVPPFQESIDWYFKVDDQMFTASLEYWQGDANANELRKTLQDVVVSIRLAR